jgi:hypothetical protein
MHKFVCDSFFFSGIKALGGKWQTLEWDGIPDCHYNRRVALGKSHIHCLPQFSHLQNGRSQQLYLL